MKVVEKLKKVLALMALIVLLASAGCAATQDWFAPDRMNSSFSGSC